MAGAPLIAERFRARFGVAPRTIASAPGRVNLVGEHTDYNDGFVLPMAIDRRVAIAAAERTDARLVMYSEEFAEDRSFDLAGAVPAMPQTWDGYALGVIAALRALADVPGMNLYIGSGVPLGAGLASSAALEIGLLRALAPLAGVSWDPTNMIRLAQRVEVEFLGVRSGIMDQTAIAAARAGHAMLLDCRSLDREYIPLPADIAVVVMDTGMRRSLSASEYNERRASCESATAAIRQSYPDVRALRDATPDMLAVSARALTPAELKRATHVVTENARPAAMAQALTARDFARAGALLDESHASLRDLYEVSSPHLDIICDTARQHAGCFGARMTGAGFGGCAIALVRADAAADFIHVSQPRYEARTYKKSEFYVVSADEGVDLLQ